MAISQNSYNEKIFNIRQIQAINCLEYEYKDFAVFFLISL